MRYGPPFQFAYRPDGRRLAYQVVGEGDLDLVSFSSGLATVGSRRAAYVGCHTGGRADRGTHRRKGIPDAWPLYAVEPAGR
jgi:hypothetical protein